MRLWISFILFAYTIVKSYGQDSTILVEGSVTFKSSVNYYVKFLNTDGIQVGDTLLIAGDTLLPSIVISSLSSTSCVGKNISGRMIQLGDKIIGRSKINPNKPASQDDKLNDQGAKMVVRKDTTANLVKAKKKVKSITGRLTASSYSSLSDFKGKVTNRLRYTFVLNANHIGDSRWSGESYISFRHKPGAWGEVKSNIFSALQVYSFALKCDVGKNDQLWLGRKINLNVSNLGAVDGIQYEKKINNMVYGAILGSRPDYNDYSFNFKLMQMGGYVGNTLRNKSGGDMSCTIGLFEQKNGVKTDRRFVYIQHSNTLVKNLMAFTSIEIDLFKMLHETPVNTFNPTSIYLSLRYKLNKKLVLSASYDALKNVIYYESYKNFIDQIIEKEVRQGLRFGAYYDPWTNVSIGASAGYRFQADHKDPSKNADVYLSFYNVPLLKMSATMSGTYLNTDYLKGFLTGVRLNKSFGHDKWSMESSYRTVHYQYSSIETPLKQKIVELGLNCRLTNKMNLSVHAENTYDGNRTFSTLYCNWMKRF